MRRIWSVLLTGVLTGVLLGAGVGIVSGQICYERAYAQVQVNPQSIQGDVGGYLCSAGKLPVLFGVLGVLGGAVVGLSGSLMVWLCEILGATIMPMVECCCVGNAFIRKLASLMKNKF